MGREQQQPTLWRTCRVLANRTRLQILQLLLHQPGQSVSSLATQLKLGLPAASQYLRALEARGLLRLRRNGRKVVYRVHTTTSDTPVPTLVRSLRLTFLRDARPIDTIYRLATAFTHPRRIELFRALNAGPQSFDLLVAATHIPRDALLRHLHKLVARGFVIRQSGHYALAERKDDLGQELTRLAIG